MQACQLPYLHVGLLGQPCSDWSSGLEPNPFYLFPDARNTPGQTLATSFANLVEKNFYTSNGTSYEVAPPEWFVAVNVNLMGGWPPDTWDGSFYNQSGRLPTGMTITKGAPLANGATLYEVGGEVATPPDQGAGVFNINSPLSDSIEMGSGVGPAEGYPWSAYFRNIDVFYEKQGLYGDGTNVPFSRIFATDLNCYGYGWGYNEKPQTVSLRNLGYTFLQYPGQNPASVVSPKPGGSEWQTYLYYGGLGWYSGSPFSLTDPNGGTNDFCCSGILQNGVGTDTQCNQE
jgi:hypothetical protein